MQKTLPFFKWYPADALADIDYASLDLPALGLFHACLNYAWVNDGLPSDPLAIARLMRIEKQKFMKLWGQISKLFPQGVGGQLRNSRQELEREGAYQKSAKASESAKARYERSANAQDTRARQIQMSDTESDTEKSASALLESPSARAYLPPVEKRREVRQMLAPIARPNGHGAEWSAKLYARHPKKKDRTLVEHALFQVMEASADPEALFAEIDQVHSLWCNDFSWLENNGRFAPTLAHWLDDRGWTQIPKPPISKEEYDLDEYDRRNGKI